ncbi:MAG: TIGR03546 family protein [Planctomycetaceae bacterium]|nr:TIGR03546 family protein [Planctomycetaceae bacterium]
MDIITGKFGPREIAFAVSFGILLGLLPKDNLTAAAIAVVFFLSRANLVLGVVITIIVSFLSPFYYPIAHRIGLEILTSDFGQEWGAALFQYPLVPWSMLDNTVVMGSFATGLALFLPVWFIVWLPLKLFWKKEETKQKKKEESKAGPLTTEYVLEKK